MSKKITSTIAGASILITGVGLLSKGFGFLREIVFANNFGLQSNFDVYLIGAVLPITLNTSVFYLAQNYFIPVYNSRLSGGKDIAEKFLSNSFWLFFIFTALFSVLLYLFSPFIIKSYIASNDLHVQENALRIFQIFLITIPFNAGFAILSAYSQSEYNFKAPAVSTLFQNVIIIVLVLSFTNSIGILTIPIGYLLGTLAQFFYLIIVLKNRTRLFPSLISLNLRNLGFMDKTLGIIILIEMVNQLYILTDRYFYANVDSGGLAALNYATVLYSLPISIFSLALSTAIFPKISQSFSLKNNTSIEAQYLSGLQINIFLFIPITYIFILFGDSLIKIFYQRGSYTVQDTYQTFEVLKLYSISLIFYSSYAIINKVVYGAGLIRILLYISLAVFTIKIFLNFILVEHLKQSGLALSTSISYIILSASCYFLVIKKLKLRISQRLLGGMLIYILNGLISYLTALLFQNFFRFDSMFNFILIFVVFTSVYSINILILKPREFLILKETLLKYFY